MKIDILRLEAVFFPALEKYDQKSLKNFCP